MEYSFKTFIEEKYKEVLVDAAETFFEHDEHCTMDVTVRYVMGKRQRLLSDCSASWHGFL